MNAPRALCPVSSINVVILADTCTLTEAIDYRRMLREIGPEKFCEQTVEAGVITAKKLITAFGIVAPGLEGQEDEAYYSILGLAIHRELHKRYKLSQYNTVDDAVQLIQKSKNIMVITGAGISTSLGIPDFRSKDTGLYSKIQIHGLNDPQEVFDIDVFRQDPSIFFSIAKDILPETKQFSPTHAFIKLLHEQGKLLTNYTQNIDNLEHWAGIPAEKLIQCHGSFGTATCTLCRHQVPGESVFKEIKSGSIPRCSKCIATIEAEKTSTGMKRKRSKNAVAKKRVRDEYDDSSDEEDDIPEPGILKPDITFFGEALPDTFHDRIVGHDKDLVDLVIVIGTSLKVAPVSDVVPFLPENIPQMYISRTPVSHINFDIDMLGDCDVVVAELCKRAGWRLEHEMISKDQIISIDLVDGFESRHLFTATTGSATYPIEPERAE